MSVDNLLDDYALEDDCAKSWGVDRRTIARYRNEPNGLPYMKLGGKVYIHISGAKEWILRRTKRRNPIRGMEDRLHGGARNMTGTQSSAGKRTCEPPLCTHGRGEQND